MGPPRGTTPPGGPWGRVGKGIEIDLDIAFNSTSSLSMSIGIGMEFPFDVEIDRFNDDFNFERSDDD